MVLWNVVYKVVHSDTCIFVSSSYGCAYSFGFLLSFMVASKSRLVLVNLPGFTFLVPAHPGGPGHIPEEQ